MNNQNIHITARGRCVLLSSRWLKLSINYNLKNVILKWIIHPQFVVLQNKPMHELQRKQCIYLPRSRTSKGRAWHFWRGDRRPRGPVDHAIISRFIVWNQGISIAWCSKTRSVSENGLTNRTLLHLMPAKSRASCSCSIYRCPLHLSMFMFMLSWFITLVPLEYKIRWLL